MSRKKALVLYLSGTLGQIWLICVMVFILRGIEMNVNYMSFIGMSAIGIGGISSALWGTIIAVKYKKYDFTKIFRDFFDVKQKYSSYLFAVLFLCIDFFYIVFNGEILVDFWYTLWSCFLRQLYLEE
jgi:hypothetical protein